MNPNDTRTAIESGKTALGVEFGSTRIKAVLIGEDHLPIASGSYDWENRYENGVWTYSLDDVWTGLQESYRRLNNEVLEKYNTPPLARRESYLERIRENARAPGDRKSTRLNSSH